MNLQEIKDKWAGVACTLNGKPAKVTGRLNKFATVGTLDGELSRDWSWDAVNRIMSDNQGKFRT